MSSLTFATASSGTGGLDMDSLYSHNLSNHIIIVVKI